jgi:hypothetical protein
MPIRNITKDLTQRIKELDGEIEKVKQSLDNLNNQRMGLLLALEVEKKRWDNNAENKESSVIINQKPELRLSDIIFKCLNGASKTIEALKTDVKDSGMDLGINQGRSIHTALYGMARKGLVEKIGGAWRIKQNESTGN